MQANLWVDKLSFKDGTTIELKKDSIVVFVGPNNSGKSLTLKEIAGKAGNQTISSKIIQSAKISIEGSAEDFFAKIEDRKHSDTYIYNNMNYNSGMGRRGLESEHLTVFRPS